MSINEISHVLPLLEFPLKILLTICRLTPNVCNIGVNCTDPIMYFVNHVVKLSRKWSFLTGSAVRIQVTDDTGRAYQHSGMTHLFLICCGP